MLLFARESGLDEGYVAWSVLAAVAISGITTTSPEPGELSLRLLRHFASGVHHRKYQGIDIVTVEVPR